MIDVQQVYTLLDSTAEMCAICVLEHIESGAPRPDYTYSIQRLVIFLVLMVLFYSVVCAWEPWAFARLLSISTEGRVLLLMVTTRIIC